MVTLFTLVPSSWPARADNSACCPDVVGRREREVVVEGLHRLALRRDDVLRGFRRVLLEVVEFVPQQLDLVQSVVAIPVCENQSVGRGAVKFDVSTARDMYWIVCFELGGVPPRR